MDTEFTPRVGNDAYGVIRGFVYQVDLTVERWLDLGVDERLELERGEDIDHLSRAFLGENAASEVHVSELLRISEQVKHLKRSITLRSASARAALCNAFEHFEANPGQRLLFRFTTTAIAGRERASPLGGIPGIQAWEALRQRTATTADADGYQQGIRTLLLAPVPPKGVRATAWRRLQEFVQNAEVEAFAAFIRRFEWSVGAPGVEARSAQILNKLIDEGHAASPEEAQGLYERLFVFVFRLLSRRGLKSLSRTDLQETMALPTLPASDRRLLRTVADALGAVEERVGSIERALAEYSAVLPSIQYQLDSLTRQQGIEAAFEYTVATPDLDPPPPLAIGAAREASVELLWDVVQRHTWTALVGASSTGKTQLALNLVRSRAIGSPWLRFRDLSTAQSAVRLDKAVESIAGPRAGRSLRKWYEGLAGGASMFELLVLDDVPCVQTGDEFAVRLDALLQACEHTSMRLLTTSAYPLPSSYRDQHPSERIKTLEVPPFTEEEIRELLLARGAPQGALAPPYIRFLKAITNDGNPALLQAMARYLSRTGWGPATAVQGSVTKEYSADVNAETVRRVLDTVEDSETRNLLYRLNLIGSDFSMKQVSLVAEVEPRVVHPQERLEQLRGLWVQSESANRYTVSPLIQTLGSADLPRTTFIDCHLALAEEMVRRPSVNELEAAQALLHFVSGGNYNGAAVVLLRGLDALTRLKEVPDAILGAVWIDSPLPVEIDLALRLQIRAFQVRLRAKQSKSLTFLLKDFDALLDQAGNREAWSVFGACLIVSVTTVPHNVLGAARYLKLIQEVWPQLPEPIRTRMGEAAKLKPATFVWLGSGSVSSEADLRAWLTNIEVLDPVTRREVVESAEWGRAAMHVASGFYLAEFEKPPPARDWNRALLLLELMERRGRELNLEPIWSAAIANRVSIIGGMLGDMASAHELADRVLSDPEIPPRTRFRINVSLGYAYLDLNRTAEARRWMEAARPDAESAPPTEAIVLLLRLSKATGAVEEAASEALKIAEEAGCLATEAGRMTGLLDAKVAGEIAVARWLNGDLHGAFLSWEQVAERVLENYPGNGEWKKLYVPFAHGAGFFSAVAGRHDPSDPDLMGREYAPAYRGMFQDTTWDLDGARLMPAAYLYVLTALFGEGVGEHERAARWATRGLAVADSRNDQSARGMLIPLTLLDAIREGRFVEAFMSSREAGQIFASTEILRTSGANTLAPFDIESVLGPPSRDTWDQVEAYALNTGVVPALLQIGRVSLTRPQRSQLALRGAADACMRVGEASTRPALWARAANVFTLLVSGAPPAELLAIGNSADWRLAHAAAAVYQLSYLAASIHQDASLTMALELHFCTAAHIQVYLVRQPALQQIAIPFFFDYWTQRVADVPFNFNTPTLVAQRIQDAAREPVGNRLAALFAVVSDGLQFRVAPEFLTRLRGGTN
jgi:hypothetical protein